MYISINNVVFTIKCNDKIKPYFENRLKLESSPQKLYLNNLVTVNVEVTKKVNYKDKSFIDRISPKFIENGIYYEIPNYGTFEFNKFKSEINVKYSDNFNSNNEKTFMRNIVTGTLQIVNLSTLFFDVLPLHASAVKKNDYGIIILGNSTKGKSTMEYLLLNSGFDFFADDVVFLDNECFIHNNNESLVSIRNGTIELSKNLFDFNLPQKEIGEEKLFIQNVNFDPSKKLFPKILLFPEQQPTLNHIEPYIIEKIDKSTLYVDLIKNSISSQIPSEFIQRYMLILKKLCVNVEAYRVIRTNLYDNSHCRGLLDDLLELLAERLNSFE